jgi:hypothetical protein
MLGVVDESEVAVIRRKNHGFQAAVQNGPAAPELCRRCV